MNDQRPTPVRLPLLEAPLIPCTQCARCCRYVAVGINAPARPRYATDILWYLYHEGVSVHCDADGEWSVAFETRCRHLGDDLLCGIYEQRPHICRAFDNQTCEVNTAGGRTFSAPEEFLEYLKQARPRVHAAVERRFLPQPAAEPGARTA
jgi:Fe-S-cluster containining protein